MVVAFNTGVMVLCIAMIPKIKRSVLNSFPSSFFLFYKKNNEGNLTVIAIGSAGGITIVIRSSESIVIVDGESPRITCNRGNN